MGTIASQITSLTIVYTTVYSDAYQRKHESSSSLAFMRGIHRGPVNSPHKWPVTRKMFPFDDVIMKCRPGGETNPLWSCICVALQNLHSTLDWRHQAITWNNVDWGHIVSLSWSSWSTIVSSPMICHMPASILLIIHIFLNAFCLIVWRSENRFFIVLNAHWRVTG